MAQDQYPQNGGKGCYPDVERFMSDIEQGGNDESHPHEGNTSWKGNSATWAELSEKLYLAGA